jgi:adenosylcobinamide kinase / adenosylcobinamide-phosphate guanylyltransferase
VPDPDAISVAKSRPTPAQGTASMLAPLTLVLGGARSGKSEFAESLLARHSAPIYLATAEAGDAEMSARIAVHRARRGPHWTTIEASHHLAAALISVAAPGKAILVDCLTIWLSNLMGAGRVLDVEIERLLTTLPTLAAPVVLVANEVGLGIVPDNALARAFRDHAGILNQRLAQICQRVVFVAAGLPLTLKDGSK